MKRPLKPSSSKSYKKAKHRRIFETEGSVHNQVKAFGSSSVNIVKLLLERQLGMKKFDKESMYLRYTNFAFKEEIEIASTFDTPLSKIHELCSPSSKVIVVLVDGRCEIYSRLSKQCIGSFPLEPNQAIISLFHNKLRGDMVFFVLQKGETPEVKCQRLSIRNLEQRELDSSISLFPKEQFLEDSYIELDEVNGLIITFSDSSSTFKFWSMETYGVLFAVKDKNLQSIKSGLGCLLLLYEITESKLPIKIVDLDTRKVIYNFRIRLTKADGVSMIEVLGDTLLFKQSGCNLRIIDLTTLTERASTLNREPDVFVSLLRRKQVLGFFGRRASVLDTNGAVCFDLEDTFVTCSKGNTNTTFIPREENVLISSCIVPLEQHRRSIHFSSISNGHLISKIEDEKLGDACCIHFNENTNELFVCNSDGRICIYTNE